MDPQKIAIYMAMGIMTGSAFSYWLVKWFLPRYGWEAMWKFRWKIMVVVAILTLIFAAVKPVLFFLGFPDVARALP